MDQITHEVRRKQWLSIVTECQARPDGTTVREWLSENGIKEKAYYYWLRKFRKEAYDKLPSLPDKNLPEANVAFAEIQIPDLSNQVDTINLSFNPDAVIKSGDCMIALSNSISKPLLKSIMEGLCHAR